MKRIETMIENLINGNVSTAKKQAKRIDGIAIYAYLRGDLGWTELKAQACSAFLKGSGSFQTYCDAD